MDLFFFKPFSSLYFAVHHQMAIYLLSTHGLHSENFQNKSIDFSFPSNVILTSVWGEMHVGNCASYLDVVQNELMSLFSRHHFAVSDGLSQSLLGNEGVQVQDRGQTTVQTDEPFFVGAKMT